MSARRSSFVRLLALLGALCLGGAAQAAGEPRRERILRFDVGATVNEDASLTVREDLEFIAMGVKISRGIIRGIPVRYRDENGRPIAVGLKVLSTSVDGVELPWKESNEGRGRFIRIGDPKRTLSPGVHRLSLTYRTTKQLGFFADHDELYWNVTGNDWDLPIQNASFRLALPGKSAGDGFGRVGWYAGRYGSTSSDGARLDDSRAVVTTRALQPGEGLTVVYSWPKGVVAPPQPSFGERFGDFVSAHGDAIARGLMWAGTALAAICLVWGALRARGEHSGEITVIPLFHAPRDMTPSLARRLTCGTDDFASLGAELIALAVNGALKISGDRRSGYRLEKTGGAPSDGLPAALMDTLFPSSSQEALNVTNAYRKRFEKSLELIKGDAKKRAEGNFLDRRAPLRRAYSALLAGAAAGALFLLTEAVSAEWGAVALLLGALALLSLRYARREPTLAPRSFARSLRNAFGLKGFFAAQASVFVTALLAMVAAHSSDRPLTFAGAALALLGLPLGKRLIFWTDKGRKQFEQALGLKMFITAAEKDRLEMLNAPDDTPALFEELLPYAVAMDCAQTWANRFEKVLAAAAWQPSWSDGPAWRSGAAGTLWGGTSGIACGLNDFSKDFSSSLGAASRAPGSSSGGSFEGSSGGGFSGGGGGGGGGRGW